jgi:hypothetical protein
VNVIGVGPSDLSGVICVNHRDHAVESE